MVAAAAAVVVVIVILVVAVVAAIASVAAAAVAIAFFKYSRILSKFYGLYRTVHGRYALKMDSRSKSNLHSHLYFIATQYLCKYALVEDIDN